jgi:Flp pilus assembly pilin Flp
VKTRESGQAMVEYGVILAFIAAVSLAVLLLLGPVVSDLFGQVGGGTLGGRTTCNQSHSIINPAVCRTH